MNNIQWTDAPRISPYTEISMKCEIGGAVIYIELASGVWLLTAPRVHIYEKVLNLPHGCSLEKAKRFALAEVFISACDQTTGLMKIVNGFISHDPFHS